MPLIQISDSHVRDLDIRNHYSCESGPALVRLKSSSLCSVTLELSDWNLHVAFDVKLEAMKIHCAQLSLEGNGRVHSLYLYVKSIKKTSPCFKILSTVRNLSLEKYLISNGATSPPIHWDSLRRVLLNNFKEGALNSLTDGAPHLSEVILEGTNLSDDQGCVSLRCRNLRLLKIENLENVKEIKVKKGKREVAIVKGTRDTTISFVGA